MKQATNYQGLDYSGPRSTVNRNPDTGIRYGMISLSSLGDFAMDEIFSHGEDLGYLSFKDEIRKRLDNALKDYLSTTAICDAFDAVEDYIGDAYSQGCCESGPYSLEQDGLKIQTTDSGELWVFDSPYFTYAQFCSPCVPGAGNLDSPLDHPEVANKTYCLGHDWFEDNKAPYPVYSVETGELINPD